MPPEPKRWRCGGSQRSSGRTGPERESAGPGSGDAGRCPCNDDAPYFCRDEQDERDWVDDLTLPGFLGFGFLQVIGDWLVQAIGDRLLDLTRFREVISPTAGGFALGFWLSFSMSGARFPCLGHGAYSMARCGGRGGRGDYPG